MHDIVFADHRPFCFLDFCPSFAVDGATYTIAPGTFRNKISQFCREGLTRFAYRSNVAFYTMRGVVFTRKEKVSRRIEDPGPIELMLKSLPLGERSLHDIRLRFSSNGIWGVLSSDPTLTPNACSKDISLNPIKFGDVEFRVTVHRTDVVSVMAACSMRPIAADVNGLVLLTECLTRLEYEIKDRITRAGTLVGMQAPQIPRHVNWIVTMWHVGRDGAIEYNGEKFNISWDEGRAGFTRIYTKDMGAQGTRIRIERQEYPQNSFSDAIESALNNPGKEVNKGETQPC